MTAALLAGAVLLTALAAYALLGGADFGGGIWSLLASGPRRAEQRELVEEAIGPVWEANHVWLVLALVVTFTAFPLAFAAVSTSLFVPLTLLLFAIVLRGSAYAFQSYGAPRERARRRWGPVFSGASVAASLLVGAIAGALATGRLRAGADGMALCGPWAWLDAFTAAAAALALALFAFLAAVYLSVEAEGALRDDFRRRALAAGALVAGAAAAALLLAAGGAPHLFHRLTGTAWGALTLALGAAALGGSLVALGAGAVHAARLLAGALVALIVGGWGAAQLPYLVAPDVTLAAAAAPPRTLALLLAALAAGALTLFPSLWLLLRVFKGSLLSPRE